MMIIINSAVCIYWKSRQAHKKFENIVVLHFEPMKEHGGTKYLFSTSYM